MINKSHDILVKTELLGVRLTNASEEGILEYIFDEIRNPYTKIRIVTPNPEMIVYANSHPAFRALLNSAEISLVDGVGITWAASFLGRRLKERVTGVDFMKKICEKCAEKAVTVGFLGAGPGVAELTAECLRKEYPGLNVVFAASELPGELINHKSYILNQSSIDVLFVAYGFPKQEEWIAENLHKIPVKVAMGVGGAFDYISGKVPRAPIWLRQAGLEWLYRLIRQPWRWKRQLALIKFIQLVVSERLNR